MSKAIKPEQYNEFGELIPEPPIQVVYERRLSSQQQHVIHKTKDLFDSNCTYCQDAAKKFRQTYWGEDA